MDPLTWDSVVKYGSTCVLSDVLGMAMMSVHEVWKLLSNSHCLHRPTGLLVRFSTATLNT